MTGPQLGTLGWDGTAPAQLPRHRRMLVDQLLANAAAARPGKTAVVFGDRSLTFAQLDALTNRAANGLIALGVRPRDVVAMVAGNAPETLALIYGISRAGGAVLPLNPRNTPEEIEFCIGDIGAKLCVGTPGGLSVDDVFAAATSEADPLVDVDETSYFQVRFTSGTTGKPKAVATTQRAVALMHLMFALEVGYAPDDVVLVNAPVAHAAFHFAASHVAVGATMILHAAFSPATVWEDVDRAQVTHMFMVPTMFGMALGSPGSGASLKALVSTASTLSPSVKERIATRFPGAGLFEMYGATELGLCTLLRPAEQEARPSSVGRAAFGYRIRVLDPDGVDCPPGEIGEIFVQGPSMCHAYVGSVPPRTGSVRDGWLSVGDLGSLDAAGYLTIAERRDDLVISGGMNVYPAEVEDVLLRVPGVREVAVIGVPDDVWGQRVVAVVAGDAPAADIAAGARTALAGYKVPRQIEYVDELPKGPTGKVLRRVLREQFGASGSGTA